VTSTRLAMAVASIMLAHQVASKAVRDAAFLGAWPATALPAIGIATAVLVVAAVPLYSLLLARFGPRVVVPAGFVMSAVGHAVEWRLFNQSHWVSVAIYLHVAGFGALLLSGFWSLVSEIFDPRSAKTSYARIAAAGTIGGLVGGVVTARMAVTLPGNAPLLLLSALHAGCGLGILFLGRANAAIGLASREPETDDGPAFSFGALRAAPHVKTLALMVVLSTAGAFVVDYLVKSEARRPEHFGTGPALLEFFALFYAAVQVITVVAQTVVTTTVRRFGLGRTISTLPGGLGVTSAIALLYPTFPMFVLVRGVEAVLRGSMFRSAYELLFVPMAPAEKRRTKTFLDVTCDRAGDAVGAVFIQALLFTGVRFQTGELLAFVVVLAAAGLWLASQLDVIYLDVVQRRLVQQGENAPIVAGSENAWTVVQLPVRPAEIPTAAAPAAVPHPGREEDPRMRCLVDLRSGDRDRVARALSRLTRPDTLQVAQVVQLLAWDEMVAGAREVLERSAAGHVGLLVDELLDPNADFAIRRRIPRILGTLSSERAVNGLVRGLDDARFEVRYQCSRAIDRLLVKGVPLPVDPQRILAIVDRELSVPPEVWHGYQLIDRVERDEEGGLAELVPARAQRNLEHVFTLLSAVLPREPLQVTFHGIRSEDAGLRGLAIEYLDGVLPAGTRVKLWAVLDAPAERHATRVSPEQALDQLRKSTMTQTIQNRPGATTSSGDAPG
jgi:AAA family ATP:ADP antiporter